MGNFIDKTKGKIKQAVGALTGNAALKRQGERDEQRGKLGSALEEMEGAEVDAKDGVASRGPQSSGQRQAASGHAPQ